MANTVFNIFLSWSGPRSGAAADAFQTWLPLVLETAKPWKSDLNIAKGSRSLNELSSALQGKVGIVFLTPENLTSTWVHFESGALSKTIDQQTRLCTYLLDGLKPQDIEAPLSMFQHTLSDKEETRKLIHTINLAINSEPRPDAALNTVFDLLWPKLEEKLSTLPAAASNQQPKRSVENMVGELLELVRSLASRLNNLQAERAPDTGNLRAALASKRRQFDVNVPAQSWRDFLKSSESVQSGTMAELRRLVDASREKHIYFVKLKYDDQIKKIVGSEAAEVPPDGLVVKDGETVVARIDSDIEKWWSEPFGT